MEWNDEGPPVYTFHGPTTPRVEEGHHVYTFHGPKAPIVEEYASRLFDTSLGLTSIIHGDDGTVELAERLTGTKVTNIDLRYNGITDVGARALLASVPKTMLEYIVFDGLRDYLPVYDDYDQLPHNTVSDALKTAIELAIAVRPYRNKLFLLLRLRFFLERDGDNAMLCRIADFLF